MHGRVATLALAALLLPAASAAAALPPGNLLANPGAEAGPGAPDDATIDPPPGWTAVGDVTAVQYGAAGGFPATGDSSALGGGANFFAGGPDGDANAATQTVDVSGAAAEIDGGGVTATVSGDFGGYAGQDDNATLTATYLSADGAPLGTLVSPRSRTPTATATPRCCSARPAARCPRAPAASACGSTSSAWTAHTTTATPTTSASRWAPDRSRCSTRASWPAASAARCRFRKPGAKAFTVLGAADQALPLGSTLDTTHGVMELSSVPTAGAATQTARFYDGQFKVTQPGGVTQLALNQPLASCHGASAAAKKPQTRKLWGSGKGSFRVGGQYSSATVRGTKWLVQDSCAGTLTRVVSGVVKVSDTVRHKTVVLRAGKKYLARPKR